jgi:dihydrofolate reductase
MIISIIVAVSENNVIGRNNNLIWNLPADMKFFKEKTIGHHVLMGRKNYESIPEKYRPLPNRVNIVVSRKDGNNIVGAVFVKDIDSGIELARKSGEEELFIIGGGEIYRQTMNTADKMYITWVHKSFEGDTFFPEVDEAVWKVKSSEFRKADNANEFDMTYVEYAKK